LRIKIIYYYTALPDHAQFVKNR